MDRPRLESKTPKREKKKKINKIAIESSHELSLKATFVVSPRPIFIPRWLISGRSFRANRRERIDRSLPSTKESFPCNPLAYIFVLTIFPCIWKIRFDEWNREKRVATVASAGAPRGKMHRRAAWEFPACRRVHACTLSDCITRNSCVCIPLKSEEFHNAKRSRLVDKLQLRALFIKTWTRGSIIYRVNMSREKYRRIVLYA